MNAIAGHVHFVGFYGKFDRSLNSHFQREDDFGVSAIKDFASDHWLIIDND